MARARRRLPRTMFGNDRPRPEVLAAFVQRALHLDGTGLMTFAISDDRRSIKAMTRALLPARDADEARTRLLAAIDGAKAVPERDAAEQFLEQYLDVPPASVTPDAAWAAEDLLRGGPENLRRLRG